MINPMNKLALFLAMALIMGAFSQSSCRKDHPDEIIVYEPQELIKMSKAGQEVTAGMLQATREKVMADLIRANESGQEKAANPKPQDTTFDAVFSVYNPQQTISGYRLWHRLRIYNGSFQPDIYSFCYVVKHSPGLIPLASSIHLEYQSNCLDFPPLGHGHGSVLTHISSTAMYFVFFDLTPFPLEWVDRIVLEMSYMKQPGFTSGWLTVDRSDPNNFALSSDGYTDYRCYFFPDTLYILQ